MSRERPKTLYCVCDPEEQGDAHGTFCVLTRKTKSWLDSLGIDHNDSENKEPDHDVRLNIKRICMLQMVVMLILGIAFVMSPYQSMANFFVTEEYITELSSSPDIRKQLETKRDRLIEEKNKNLAKNEGAITELINSLTNLLTQHPNDSDAIAKRDQTIQLIDDILVSQDQIDVMTEKSAPVVAITTPIVLLGCCYFSIVFLTYQTRSCKKLEECKIHANVYVIWGVMHILGFVASLASKAGGYESTRFMLFILLVNILMIFGWNGIKNQIDHHIQKTSNNILA